MAQKRDASKPRPLMAPEAKRALLTQKKTEKAIRRVAMSRAVPYQDRADIVQQTVAFAWKARVPEDEAQARRFINRIAFRVACTWMGQKPGEPYEEDSTDEEEGTAPAANPAHDPALRDGVDQLLETARKRFPNRADAFVDAAVKGTSAVDEARARGVSEGHVRKERSDIRAFMKEHGGKLGLVGLGILVLVFGDISGWSRVPFQPGRRHTSDLATIRHEVSPLSHDAAALRARAAEMCRNAHWEACLQDLDAARAIDPRPDTEDEERMRLEAMRELTVEEAPSGGALWMAKPPLR